LKPFSFDSILLSSSSLFFDSVPASSSFSN
jgi:hypothetical protein